MRTTIARLLASGFGVALLVCAMAGSAFASGPAAAPEIDGSSIAVGLAGLTAAVLIVRSRRVKDK